MEAGAGLNGTEISNGSNEMKKVIAVAAGVLLSAMVFGLPVKTFDWTGPDQYVDGTPIPTMDTITFEISCGTSSGGPYNVHYPINDPDVPPHMQDLETLVQGNPGTYYCVNRAYSTFYDAWSANSNEINFTVVAQDLVRVPMPPTNFQIVQ